MILPPSALSIEEYHASVPAWLSKTSIMDFRTWGPARWYLVYVAKTLRRPVPGGVEQGQMRDCWLTEGEQAFRDRYVVIPADAPKRPSSAQLKAKKPSADTLDAIAYWSLFEGKLTVTREDYDILLDAVEAVHGLEEWPRVQEAQAQMTLRRLSSDMGFGVQSRPDWMALDGSNAITDDLKKTRSLEHFGAQALDLGYHVQAAIAGWALAGDGYEHERANLIAVEWERGARADMYRIPTEALAGGVGIFRETAAEINARMLSGDWSYRQGGAKPLPIPAWRMRQMEGAA